MGHPGKRAPTVQICDSDKPYEPLAMRQHTLGPSPIDPNLIAQGVSPDDRVDFGDHIYGPVEGTPMPPGEQAPPPPPDAIPPPQPVPGATDAPTTPTDSSAPAAPASTAPGATPNSYRTNGSAAAPSGAVAQYDPRTGDYLGSDGKVYQQSNIVAPGAATSWKDLLLHTNPSDN
jgi:hypothetical protein